MIRRKHRIPLLPSTLRPSVITQDLPFFNTAAPARQAHPITLEALATVIAPVRKSHFRDQGVTALARDSRKVIAGSVFFAIKGELEDGNTYISEALRRGAIAIVTDQPEAKAVQGASTLWVKDARQAMALASRTFHNSPDTHLHLVGITGTNGKTTVSRTVKHLLDEGANRCGLIGTIDYIVGKRTIPSARTTPESEEICRLLASMVQEGCSKAVMEVSSHGLSQHRVEGLHFDTVAFLNLTQDHLDYHGDMQSYFHAKARLFDGRHQPLPRHAVIHADDPYGKKILACLAPGIRAITFSAGSAADFCAENIKVNTEGSRFRLNTPTGSHEVFCHLLGAYNVENVLAALACGYASGASMESLIESLHSLPPVPGRLENIRHGQPYLVVVDYAHSPDALEKVLATLSPLVDGKIKVVFGCGGDRDRGKRPLMTRAVCRHAQEVWATSDNPRSEAQERIFEDMLKGVEPHTRMHFIKDRESAIRDAILSAAPGDAVLIAGKGHETYQETHHTVVPFDDRQVARTVLKEQGFHQ
jgi:UDP-N-acetylmuramoyl-L-alanyl-D-glutamate--2,6-diaminopimelate ligase